ncbi:MAG: hypothetical protein SWY16_17260 [Cyanobacteriota bacterium]|nr:hypothetical protein [Cyanobacteriota bacterium]
MSKIFTTEQIDRLSQEIDTQLQELNGQTNRESLQKDPSMFPISGLFNDLPEKQSRAIEKVTKERPESFLRRFGTAAKKDLCEEDGVLNQQWKKWGDLSNEDVLERFGIILVAMGIPVAAVETLAVSLAVIVLHLTVKTFCEEYGEKSEEA